MATSKFIVRFNKAQAGIEVVIPDGRRLIGEELSMGGTARTITRRTAHRSECESARTPRPTDHGLCRAAASAQKWRSDQPRWIPPSGCPNW